MAAAQQQLKMVVQVVELDKALLQTEVVQLIKVMMAELIMAVVVELEKLVLLDMVLVVLERVAMELPQQ